MTITFNKIFISPGTIQYPASYTLLYRQYSDAGWTTIDTGVMIDVDGTILDSPLPSVELQPDIYYIIRMEDETCGSYFEQQFYIPSGNQFYWIPDDTYCEQDNLLNLVDSITGFADPRDIGYDETTGRVYVVDASAITSGSNIYWFNPETITSSSDVTPVGSLDVFAIASVMDMEARKIYITGSDTGGMIRYDIATDTVDTLSYGDTAVYTKLVLFKTDNNKLFSLDTEAGKIFIIDIASFTVESEAVISSIPDDEKYISDGSIFHFINNEWWVIQSQGSPSIFYSGDIAKYDSTFTTLLGTIPLPDQDTWTNSSYWRTSFIDGDNLLIYDAGSNQIVKVDINTEDVSVVHEFTNREGKTNSLLSVVRDEITGELYATGVWTDDANTDHSPLQVTYGLDLTTYEPIAIYPDIAYGIPMKRVGLSDLLVSTYAGVLVYPDNPVGASTDGLINLFSKSGTGNNTGMKIVVTIQKINAATLEPTGDVKPNVIGDADYIAPFQDLVNCPPTYTIQCPEVAYTITGTDAEYEYSLAKSTYVNPVIDHLVLQIVDTVTTDILQEVSIPKNLYQNGTVSKIGSNPNQANLIFLDSDDGELEVCEDIFTIP